MLVTAVVGAACAARNPAPAGNAPRAPAIAKLADPDPPLDLHADSHALVADALAARARGDDAGARRIFERARLIAEATSGVHAQVVPAEDYTTTQGGALWSPDGRYVVYEHGSGSTRGMLVVDTQTWTSLRVDRGAGAMFSADSSYIVITGGQSVSAYELATGRTVVEPSPTTMSPTFVADGKLAWAAIDGNDDVVYLRDLAGGQIALRAPRPPGSQTLSGLHDVIFAAPDRLIAWGYAPNGDIPLRVFSIPERRELVSFLSSQNTAKLVGDRMYYARKQGHASQLRFAGLRDPAHDVPQPSSSNKKCGAGLFDEDSRILKCTPELVVVAHDHTACEWELSTGKLTRTWPTGANPAAACDRKQLAPPRRRGMMPMPMPMPMDGDVLDIDLGPPDPSGARERLDNTLAKLEDRKHAAGLTASPNGAFVAGFVLANADFARAPKHGDEIDSWSNIAGGRPRIWNAVGKIVWTAAEPSGASEVALAPNGDVVLAARDGRIWHVGSKGAARTMRTTEPPDDCALSDFGVLPDGRAAMFCRAVEYNWVLRIEGEKALIDSPSNSASARIATSASAASAMIASDAGLLVYSLPSGKVLWTSDVKNGVVPRYYELNATTLAPSGDRMALLTRGALAVVDHDTVLWQKAEGEISPEEFSPDGALVITQPLPSGEPQVRDAATGAIVDTLPGGNGSVAFASASLVVYLRRTGDLDTGEAALVVRDVKAKRELSARAVPRSIAAYVESLAASSSGTAADSATKIAAINPAGLALLWGEGASPRATIAPGGNALTITDADGTIWLLGDVRAARDHLACRIGNVLFPFEVCEGRVQAP